MLNGDQEPSNDLSGVEHVWWFELSGVRYYNSRQHADPNKRRVAVADRNERVLITGDG